MHIPEIQRDAALALLSKDARLNAFNAAGDLSSAKRVNTPGSESERDSFRKMLEKAMNESRAADKTRDDERETNAREAQRHMDKTNEGRKADDAARNADKVSDNRTDKFDGGKSVAYAESPDTAKTFIYAMNADDMGEFAENESIELFGAKDAAAFEDELAALKEQKAAQGEDRFLLDALAEQRELAAAGQETAGRKSRGGLEPQKDSTPKHAEVAAAAFFNAPPHNVNAATVTQNPQADGAEKTETTGAVKKQNFFEGDKPLFSVIDERSVSSREKPARVTAVSHEGNHAELQLSLSGAAKNTREISPDAARNGGAESKFASMLSREIKNNAQEFVKAGSIVLRDNDSGSIRLALHPDDLGDVKILLRLTDNNIAARISVATKEAYEAFKSSIDSLKQAFNDSGFSTGDFNLSWTGGGAQGNARQNHHGQESSRQSFEHSYAQYVNGIPDFDDAPDERSFTGTGGLAAASAYAVNIMA